MTMDEVANGGISADATRRPLTPTLPTPTGSKTPPTISRREFGESSTNLHSRRTSEAMEADSLSRRLKEFEAAGSVRSRDRTPGRSPSRKRQRVYGDRYVGTCPRSPSHKLVLRSGKVQKVSSRTDMQPQIHPEPRRTRLTS